MYAAPVASATLLLVLIMLSIYLIVVGIHNELILLLAYYKIC